MTVRCAAVVGIDAVASLLHRVPGQPRVVVSGNHVTPSGLLGALGADLESYRLFALNAQLVTVSRIPGPA